MDKIKDNMNAKARAGEAGVQSRRIAAQAGREYILQHDPPASNASGASGPAPASNPAGVMEISVDLPSGERCPGNPPGVLDCLTIALHRIVLHGQHFANVCTAG